jgi:hypothetical protein
VWPRRHSRPDYKPKQIIAMIEQKLLDRTWQLPERSFSHATNESHCDRGVGSGDCLFDFRL